jgi:serine/threonine-protein kinase
MRAKPLSSHMNWTWRKIAVIASGLLLVAVLVGGLIDQLLLPWYVSMTDTVRVPNLVGRTVDEARAMCTDVGLNVMEPREQFSATVPKGTVMSQLPYANATVKEGRRIYLTVSRGIETIRVPSLYGLTVRDARLTLMRLGLRLGTVTYEASDAVAVDRIAAQGVPPGAEIPGDGVIAIVVSRGTAGIRVPSLVGLSLDEARGVLLDAGLTPGAVVEMPSGAFDAGVIISHSPMADSTVAQGTEIRLVVAK